MRTYILAIAFLLTVVAVNSQVFSARPVIPIVQKDEFRDDAGQFTLRYVSGDGTTISETGKLIPNDEGDDHVLVKEGSYQFTSPEGKTFSVRYVADKSGFRAEGDHLPVAPVA